MALCFSQILPCQRELSHYSPQEHHAIRHESSDSNICKAIKHKEDMALMQHMLTALLTPANPQQCTELFNCHAVSVCMSAVECSKQDASVTSLKLLLRDNNRIKP